MKTRIGVSMNYCVVDEGGERAYLDREYLDYIASLGGVAIPISPVDDGGDLESLLDEVDGILFTGGLDLDPGLWGQIRHEQSRLVHSRRGAFEFVLYEASQKRGLPILGICLGVQMVNVWHGGSLYQHLPEFPGKVDHGSDGNSTEHVIIVSRDSRLYDLLKVERITVKSGHHQGINRLGNGLLAAAMAEDGVVEAVERRDYPFLMAVQWHPERERESMISRMLGEEFIKAASLYNRSTIEK